MRSRRNARHCEGAARGNPVDEGIMGFLRLPDIYGIASLSQLLEVAHSLWLEAPSWNTLTSACHHALHCPPGVLPLTFLETLMFILDSSR